MSLLLITNICPSLISLGFTNLVNYLGKKGKLKNTLYESQKKQLLEEYLEILKKDINQVKLNFITTIMNKNNNFSQIDEIINNILVLENYQGITYKKIKYRIGEFKFLSNSKNINILILGKTGVGKSTLINSLLKLKGEEAINTTSETGDSVTRGKPKGYVSSKTPGLRLWDTEGISLSNEIDKSLKDTQDFINNNALSNNPENFINCIWYCVNGERFEEKELIFITKLMDLYTDKNLPIILVYTKAVDDNVDIPMIQKIKKRFENYNRDVFIFKILAKDKEIVSNGKSILIKSYGIKELIDITCAKMQYAFDSAYYHSVRSQIVNKYNVKIDLLAENLRKNSLDEICNFDELPSVTTSNLKIIAQKFLYDNQKYLTQDSNLEISYFLKKIYSNCHQIFKELFLNYINESCAKLAIKYQETANNTRNWKDKLSLICKEMSTFSSKTQNILDSEIMKSKNDLTLNLGGFLENQICIDLNKTMEKMFINSFQRILSQKFSFLVENISTKELNLRMFNEIQQIGQFLIKKIK